MGQNSDGCWLLVGLGNVGKRYTGTRHNIGFAVLDLWASKFSSGSARKTWNHSESISTSSNGVSIVACWPTTFMNLSGDAVQELAAFYRVDTSRIVVVHDDIDLPCGKLRVRIGGGDGGQKGVRSIIERTGSADFIRIKVGVGRPPDPRFEVADWVLSRFSAQDATAISNAVESAVEAIGVIFKQGAKAAQNQFNRDPKEKPVV